MSPATPPRRHLAYVIGTYPIVTTTFITRELAALREMGHRIEVISIRRPPAAQRTFASAHEIGPVRYLLPARPSEVFRAHASFAARHPGRYARTCAYLVARPHLGVRARLRTLLHFGEGVLAAYVLRDVGVEHLHAHFVDRAATVALVASRLLRVPYSLTAHANDLYRDAMLLPEKLGSAAFAVTVSHANRAYLAAQSPRLDPARLHVLHGWVDPGQWRRAATAPSGGPLRIVSVGRLVEKKGHRHLIEACRLLRDADLDFECRIVGEGPLRPILAGLIGHSGLEPRVTLAGALSEPEVKSLLADSDLFVLPCVVAADGDRDGMPVAIAEAMAMELPVISTTVPGIDEMVSPTAGILVAPGDAVALADAIRRIATAGPDARRRMGAEGRRTVEAEFAVPVGATRLSDLFESTAIRADAAAGVKVADGPA